MKLNLGCGHVQPVGWVNVDGSNRAWLASRFSGFDRLMVRLGMLAPTEFGNRTTYANLLRQFPWPDQSVEFIYMGEFLEHLTRQEAFHVVRECHRVLQVGGAMRIRVPDHARFWRNYLEEYEQCRQQPRQEWSLSHTRWTEMYFDNLCVKRPHVWQSMGHFHKWMYDDVSLILLLESVGFKDCERMAFQSSGQVGIEDVEVRDDLIVEGVRP